VFFLKLAKVALTAENITDSVTHGEVGEAPLETLSAMSQEVLLPLLANPANQAGWPDVVAKDVTDTLHKFISEGMQYP
jgi:dynein heavy chain, axonemal